MTTDPDYAKGWLAAVTLPLVLLALCGCNSPRPIRCPTRYFFVLDRTTKFDQRSRSIVADGVKRMLSDDLLSGEFTAYELRGTGLGYMRIIEPTEIPAAPQQFHEAKCPIDVFGSSYGECLDRNAKGKSDEAAARRKRASALSSLTEKILAVAMTDAPDSSDTVISEALLNMDHDACEGQYCVFYVFSDLIEKAVRPLVHRKAAATFEAATAAAEKQADSLLGEGKSGGSKSRLAVLVWGIGRDEVQGREIGGPARQALEAYWRALLARIGATGGVELSFEFPDLTRAAFPTGREQHACLAR